MSNKTPPQMPQDLEAEQALLGSMMMSGDCIDEVRTILNGAEAFADARHAAIYLALVSEHDQGRSPDLVLMQPLIARIPDCSYDYAIELCESFADWANADQYARRVAQKHQIRRLIAIAEDMERRSYAAGKDPDSRPEELGESVIGRIEAVQDESGGQETDVHRLADGIPGMFRGANVKPPIPTGLNAIDGYIRGLQRGAMTVLGAATSTGKTALALQIAVHASATVPVLFISVEMPTDQIMGRILSGVTNVSMNRIEQDFSDGDLDHATYQVKQAFNPEKLFILSGVHSVTRMVAAARVYVRKYGVGLVVVDYLQLCDMPGRWENNNLRVAEMSKVLQRFALKSGAAVLALSQLRRTKESPTLSDLRDSGAIEQDAHAVILLWRRYPKDNAAPSTETRCDVAKNRNGPTFSVPLEFQKSSMRFVGKVVSSMDVDYAPPRDEGQF